MPQGVCLKHLDILSLDRKFKLNKGRIKDLPLLHSLGQHLGEIQQEMMHYLFYLWKHGKRLGSRMAWLYKCAEFWGRDHGDRGKKDQLKHFVLIQPARHNLKPLEKQPPSMHGCSWGLGLASRRDSSV